MTEINENVPIPEKPKKSRARKAATAKKKSFNPALSLIDALKFVSVTQKKAGPVKVQFSLICNHWIVASDDVLTVAHPIEEDLKACPHTLQLIDALQEVKDELSITQLSQNTLCISSGVFKALVPCVLDSELFILGPDPWCAVLDNRIKETFTALLPLVTENALRTEYGCILLQANTAVSTNGSALLEYWHGIDLPPGLLIPKVAAVAISKVARNLTGFGFSEHSATFYFENGSFIKTQLYKENYPAYASLFEVDVNPWQIPAEFFNGVKAVESFSEEGAVFFKDGYILSQSNKEEASSYKVEGLPEGMAFNIKNLLLVKHAFNKVNFFPEHKRVLFFGENIRGILMSLDLEQEKAYVDDKTYLENVEGEKSSEDVPF